LILPKGEWIEALVLALKVAGLPLERLSSRSYRYTFVSKALPIVFDAIRTKDMLSVIQDQKSTANGGFTGDDIIEEQKFVGNKARQWQFPLEQLNPAAPKPKVYLGSTPNLRAKIMKPTIADAYQTMVVTQYPNLTAQLFFIENPDMSNNDRLRVDDFREKIYQAVNGLK